MSMRLPSQFFKISYFIQPLLLRLTSASSSASSISTSSAPFSPIYLNGTTLPRRPLLIPTSIPVRPSIPIPILSYPICTRNFTCSAPWKQDFQTIMADIKAEVEVVERMGSDAAATEGEILEGNKEREEALKTAIQECEEGVKKASISKDEIGERAEKGISNEKEEEKGKLPKLSAAEFRVYNSMAEHMEYFHNHFRQTWNTLYNACITNKRPSHLSLKQFLQLGLQFISHLTAHHNIEEMHIFPVLATKMPEFKNGKGGNAAELLRQHREIHKGMDGLEGYLRRVRSGEVELELGVLKEKMDCWGEVLWKHLDQEVVTLGAENMRRYWTLEEMRRMPM